MLKRTLQSLFDTVMACKQNKKIDNNFGTSTVHWTESFCLTQFCEILSFLKGTKSCKYSGGTFFLMKNFFDGKLMAFSCTSQKLRQDVQ